jgi:hypothetical protein
MRPNGSSRTSESMFGNDFYYQVRTKKYPKETFNELVFHFETFSEPDEGPFYEHQLWKVVDTMHFFLMNQSYLDPQPDDQIIVMVKVLAKTPEESYFIWVRFYFTAQDLINIGYSNNLDGNEEDYAIARYYLATMINAQAKERIDDAIQNNSCWQMKDEKTRINYEAFDPGYLSFFDKLELDWTHTEIDLMKIIINK